MHYYVAMGGPARAELLFAMTDDDVILLQRDLEYEAVSCPLLADEVARRGLSPRAPEDHLLPPEFFERDVRRRRLPSGIEYAWRRGLFLGCKLSIIWLALMGIFLGAGQNVPAGVAAAVGGVGLVAPLFLSWFTPFFRPLRYTLVRPFNEDLFSKPLKRFLVRNVGLRCIGFTLSDRRFSPSRVLALYHRFRWLFALAAVAAGAALSGVAMIVAVISTWVRQSIRITTILAPSGVVHLRHEFRRHRLLAGKHFYCGGQCFNIRTIEEGWKYAMQALVHEADFFIVDLSFVRAGSHWEIELLQLRERLPRCIPVCQVDHTGAVGRYASLFPDVVLYDASGRLADRGERFVKRIRRALAS